MANELPEYFFRVRENGAFVFRIDTENRHQRIEMDQIAVVNVRNGEIKPNGDRTLSKADLAAIKEWKAQRVSVLVDREFDDVHRVVDQLNWTAAWANSRATDAQLASVTDDLLLAMHDLRSVLVRKKADQVAKDKK